MTAQPRSEFGVGFSRSMGCIFGVLLIGAVLVGGCALVLSAIGDMREAANRAAEETGQAAAPQPPAMSIEVISIGPVPGPFVEVSIKATNTSAKPITFAKGNCVLLNAEGREFAVEQGVIVNPLDGDLAAGAFRYYKFLVSADASQVKEAMVAVDDIR